MSLGGSRGATVRVSTRGGPFTGVSPAVVERRAAKMIEALGLPAVELSVALVDDATIRELNRRHRRKDRPTDVLAFPLEEAGHAWRAREMLGDVIVSVPTARRQAARRRRPLLAELTMLLAHGLLHLLGHDHRTLAEDRAMTARTRELEAAATTRRRVQRPSPKRPTPGA